MIVERLATPLAIPSAALQAALYRQAGAAAARHLLRVAAGLESVVVGEAQIVARLTAGPDHPVALTFPEGM